MDHYILFRTLNHLWRNGRSQKSDLIYLSRSAWRNNPLDILEDKGFISKEVIKSPNKQIFYSITPEGTILAKKMYDFYKLFHPFFEGIHINIEVKELKSN